MNMVLSLAAIPLILLYLAILGLSIYCVVLFIKLAHRGIKALDIYIEQNRTFNSDKTGGNQE